MKAVVRQLVPAFFIFVVVIAVVGTTYAWVKVEIPFGGEYTRYKFVELSGEVDPTYLEFVSDGLESNKTYEYWIKILNTSDDANAHLRAYVLWTWEETSGTQVAIPKNLIDFSLKEGDDADIDNEGWRWVKSDNDSWIRKNQAGDDHILAIGEDLDVKLSFKTGDLTQYQTDDLNLRVSFVVEFEGELTWML